MNSKHPHETLAGNGELGCIEDWVLRLEMGLVVQNEADNKLFIGLNRKMILFTV